MSNNMRRVHVIVYGRVQGVFFRHNTKKIADRFNVKGWVRNNPNDTVEIIAEGKDGVIDKFLNWCRKGPIGARIDKLEVREEEYQGEVKEFSIIY